MCCILVAAVPPGGQALEGPRRHGLEKQNFAREQAQNMCVVLTHDICADNHEEYLAETETHRDS